MKSLHQFQTIQNSRVENTKAVQEKNSCNQFHRFFVSFQFIIILEVNFAIIKY